MARCGIRPAGLLVDTIFSSDGTTGVPATHRATRIVNRLRELVFLITSAGPHGDFLRISPPLVFGTDHGLVRLDQALRTLDRTPPHRVDRY